MRIRTILTAAFLITSLIPGLLYGLWSHNQAMEREFSEVGARHLLIARNLRFALERYYSDLKSAFDSISSTMVDGSDVSGLLPLMREHEIVEVVIVDKADRLVLARATPVPEDAPDSGALQMLDIARTYAWPGVTRFSPVVEGPGGRNEILAVHDYGRAMAVARISTSYFVELASAVVFGVNGRAAIFDQAGNVLAHPDADWVAQRKNLADVPAVRKMMAGNEGIERFHSPLLGEELIAGITSVPGTGWGVMVPQPVSEIRENAFSHSATILKVLAMGLVLTLIAVMVFVRSLVGPLEEAVRRLRHSAAFRELHKISTPRGLVPIRELSDFATAYNHMVEEISAAHGRINTLAFTDPVTELPNRTHFLQVSRPLVAAAVQHGHAGALFYIDLDNFKEVNDLHGHDMGDIYLRLCGNKLRTTLANQMAANGMGLPEDGTHGPIVARFGGDEFVLLAPQLGTPAQARALSAMLQKEIAVLADELGLSCASGASIGCALYPTDAETVDELLKFADIAMYRAKQAGGANSVFYNARIGRQTPAEVRHEVLRAIENDELTLEYQPKVRTSDWSPSGAEALVRWDHPERGRLAPDLWLPAISDTTAIMKLGEWVIARAMKDYPVWAGDRRDLKLAVNFGSRHFVAPGFADWLGDAVKRADFDAHRLVVEVTEDTLLSSEDNAQAALNRLRDLGFTISIDDFGKGYSNVARLAELPVDQVKIDRSIVSGAATNKRLLAIMRCILDMARELGCETVAEGVETLKQADFMARNGADVLQGYYFSNSLPPEELAAWLERSRSNPVHARRKHLKSVIH